MADTANEKTEKATAHKRSEERKKGKAMQSKDVITAIFILLIFNIMRLFASLIFETAQRNIKYWISIAGAGMEENGRLIDGVQIHIKLIFEMGKTVLISAGPILLASMIISVVGSGTQTNWIFSRENIKFKLSKLNPFAGMKKFFSLKSLFETVKSIAKLAIIVVILYNDMKGRIPDFARTMEWDIAVSVAYMASAIYSVAMKIGIAFIAIAVLDFIYQKWQWEKDLMMTKEEVKEEHKELEGDPKIRSKRRQIQMRMAMQRMMAAVPQADLIIKNPTHYAVAVQYDAQKDNAPRVIAKGKDNIALRIIKIGEENEVVVVENKPLARALHDTVKIDAEIPSAFYQAVAEVLAFVYDLKNKKLIY